MKQHVVDNTPDISLHEKIGAASFTVAEAVAELVANCMDVRVDDKPLNIEVKISPESVEVLDDGTGMDLSILKEAIRLAVNMDEYKERKGRKGMYGLGLKTACASLGRHWSILTRSADTDYDLYTEVDFDALAKRTKADRTKWSSIIEEQPRKPQSPLGKREHGTLIRITKLRDRSPMAGPVIETLGRAYKPHIASGDRITINGTAASTPEYDLLEDSKQEFDKTFGTHGYRVHGWVGLDRKTHNDDAFGLNLYRKNQLIAPWNKDWFRVHLMTSKIVGEVHVDFVPVNFHKKGFVTQSEEWKDVTQFMREFMKPFVRASEQSIKGRNDSTKEARAVQGLRVAMGAAPGLNFSGAPGGNETGSGEAGKKAAPKAAVETTVDAATLVLDDGPISLSYVLVDGGEEEFLWNYLYDSDARDLVAVINSQSQAFKETKDQELLAVMGLADVVMDFMMKERASLWATARDIRNRWITIALKNKKAVKKG